MPRAFPLAFAAIACLVAGAAIAAQPWRMRILDARAIETRCAPELERARGLLRAMEKPRPAGAILAEWNRYSAAVQDFIHPVYLLANVATDAATRAAALECVERFTPLETEAYQSERLHARVRAVRPANAADRQYRQDLLDAFEDAGVALPRAQRERVKAIREELDKLSLRFESNLNEDTSTVLVTPEEAAGMPKAWIDARKRDGEDRLVVTLDYPTYVPFLENAVNEEARRRVYIGKLRQGGTANLELLDRVVALRYELAQAYGYPDYATFALRRSMAGTPAAVEQFLADVRRAVDQGEARDLAALRADKATLLGRPADDVTLHRWDVAFHETRLRRSRFQVDQEALRANFPSDKSVAFALRLAQVLYGVTFVARDVPRWSDDVRYFDVFEQGEGGRLAAFIGGIYLDLYPREGKYNHAAAFPLRSASTLSGRKPATALVANLQRAGLTQGELKTLLHEFGHVLHAVLAKTRYLDHGGALIKRDFIEAPSAMFEEWMRHPEPLGLFAEVCPECPRLAPEMVARLEQARQFGIGVRYARQSEYATFDMRIHTGKPGPVLPVWIDVERASRLGHVEGALFPASFSHLLGGYAAGYYGYMWAQVLALDMLAGFNGNLLDPAAGRRYRKEILEKGGERPPQELVEAFLGRKPNGKAFFAEITGARK